MKNNIPIKNILKPPKLHFKILLTEFFLTITELSSIMIFLLYNDVDSFF